MLDDRVGEDVLAGIGTVVEGDPVFGPRVVVHGQHLDVDLFAGVAVVVVVDEDAQRGGADAVDLAHVEFEVGVLRAVVRLGTDDAEHLAVAVVGVAVVAIDDRVGDGGEFVSGAGAALVALGGRDGGERLSEAHLVECALLRLDAGAPAERGKGEALVSGELRVRLVGRGVAAADGGGVHVEACGALLGAEIDFEHG
ncbi:MAG: hypothetical protein BRD29_00005 [Bacteroidetes bacterium QH_2_67_10]|nr:MAG: hypothetical protein BRD29_00005 [Bacteroidetes bacterium QH_2_67_10]